MGKSLKRTIGELWVCQGKGLWGIMGCGEMATNTEGSLAARDNG